MSVLRPEILVIGLDPAGVECALGAAFSRRSVILVTQQAARARKPGGLEPLNRLAALGVRIIEGEGRFRDPNHFFVEGHTIAAHRCVLALPGAVPPPVIPGLEAAPVWVAGAPARAVLVLGGGPQAGALAHAARQQGHRAILIAPEGLLTGFDSEAAAVMAGQLTREGVVLHLGRSLEGATVEKVPEGFLLHLAQGAPLGFSHGCSASLALPALAGLALEEAGVRIEAGRPRLGNGLMTSNPRILALGATRSPLADAATARAEAGIALAQILLRVAPEAALARLPRLAYGPLDLLEAGQEDAATLARPRGKTRYYRVPLAGGGMLKAVTDPQGRILRISVLAHHPAALAPPLVQALADRRPLATLASLPLPTHDEADAVAALGRLALAERLSGFGARAMIRLLRLLG